VSVLLIGAPIGVGAGIGGTEAGPRALRSAGLLDRLLSAGHQVKDAGDLPCPESLTRAHTNSRLKAVTGVASWSELIRQVVRQMPIDRVPVLLGGDHSLSLGSLTGLAERARRLGRPFFVLWIDAHPDCHTLATTQSGHLHGTPMAYILGENGFTPDLPAPTAPVAASNVLLLGIRSIDEAENSLITRHGLHLHGPAEIWQRGIHILLAPFLDRVVRENGLLHVSLDADVLDPSIAPGVGTPVPGGLLLQDLREIMDMVAASGAMTSIDLVELNPFLDRGQRTAQVMVELAAAALGFAVTEKERKIASQY
jgi:arginase